FQLQARRHQSATGEMGAQLIELVDDGAFHRSAFEQSCKDESHILTRRNRNSSADNPSNALRTPKIAVDRFLIQFIERENVEVGQKSSMANGIRSTSKLSSPVPTFVHQSFRAVTDYW